MYSLRKSLCVFNLLVPVVERILQVYTWTNENEVEIQVLSPPYHVIIALQCIYAIRASLLFGSGTWSNLKLLVLA